MDSTTKTRRVPGVTHCVMAGCRNPLESGEQEVCGACREAVARRTQQVKEESLRQFANSNAAPKKSSYCAVRQYGQFKQRRYKNMGVE